MDGRLIFLHQLCGQTKRRFEKGERHLSMFPKGTASRKGEGVYDPKVPGIGVKKNLGEVEADCPY